MARKSIEKKQKVSKKVSKKRAGGGPKKLKVDKWGMSNNFWKYSGKLHEFKKISISEILKPKN